ncbi:16S rRNA (cytosine(967)-C(5))-methyltransferase RsmB [Ramlibacter sp. USB13]|uniref:16S rRNA (cytosine(967)-C(5))-methyltransferase n=1 Tax=Ramlibacter cellulosilyticus TaxID=2764187 RepID=A0A923MVI8_9BURK|nr:16S rRNA (cytosine(967)-C(5))-methyltransferase RsmB [Ramlibacter cellulosilyticus]MBC5785493.1 16S rRNA (cytosine(967)-C(5))-methyltransferase RsmB [Ramlibacter cellulosilyticus]
MQSESHPSSPPLWRQLQAAASVLAAVRRGESATPAIAAVDAPLRPAAQALSFQVLRQLGRAEALRRRLAKRGPPPAADALLCTALALAWSEDDAPYPAFTLVDQAVEAAKRWPQTRPQQGFINACLRRFLREREQLVAEAEEEPVAHWNHPRWWIARLQQDWPQRWEEILQANNRPAPMTLRVNTHRISREPLRDLLAAAHIGSEPVGAHGLLLDRAHPVQAIPGFAEGLWSVQDAGAQLAAELLVPGLPPNASVLDACAAPGGKTAHICELAPGAQVLALDVDPVRCERIHQNLERLGLHADVRTADAGEPGYWWDGQLFDAILLDAPCTASGIVRRHPDVRWLRREKDVTQLAEQQERLLTALWPLLKPGGRLVYCTCSVFRAEGEAQVRAFLAHNTTAVSRPAPGHLWPRHAGDGGPLPDNSPSDHDGFFYAVLEKSALDAPARQDD